MIRIKNLELRIKLFSALFFILIALFWPIESLAVDATPSADIKAKLEELKKEIASKAAKLKAEVNLKLKDKAYVGRVKLKSKESLTLATHSDPKIVSINQDTIYESKIKGKTKFSFKVLAEEDYVAGLGDIDETGVLIAKKIILLPEAKSEKPKAYLWGQIVSISDKLLTLKDTDLKNVSATVPNLSAVKLNDFVILSGRKNKNNIFEAQFIYVIPQGGILKPKKMATPSAQTASPSAKPSSKKIN